MTDNIIKHILDTTDKVDNNRNIYSIFTYLVEEVGELSTEINIDNGFSDKKPGKDGIIGEAIDAILCLIDIIKVHQPDITEEEMFDIVRNKCYKWVSKHNKPTS